MRHSWLKLIHTPIQQHTHTQSHQIITVTQSSTRIKPSISSHLSFTPRLKHTHSRYLLSRDGRVVERWGLQRKSDVFAVVLNLTENILDLVPPFLQHREAGQIWEQLCLISRPPQTHKHRQPLVTYRSTHPSSLFKGVDAQYRTVSEACCSADLFSSKKKVHFCLILWYCSVFFFLRGRLMTIS